MKIYAIASRVHQVYGHGDRGFELMIQQRGMYGKDGFFPLFITRKLADAYFDQLAHDYDASMYEIVELELMDKPVKYKPE